MTCARQQPVVNGEICKTYGSGNGKSVAQEACGITQVCINLLHMASCCTNAVLMQSLSQRSWLPIFTISSLLNKPFNVSTVGHPSLLV
jgi:hypothetical protein